MALTTIDKSKAASNRNQQELMEAAIVELQRIKQLVVAGGAADAQLTATGLATADKIIGVIRFDITGGNVVAVTDLTASASIPAADKLAIAGTDTTGDTLLVTFYDVA